MSSILVAKRDKLTDLRDLVKTAAERHRPGLTIETHHRLASEPGVVSPRRRDEVMGSPHYYCEVLPVGAPTEASAAGGRATSVAHEFNVWLALEYEESDTYEGSTQEEFDQIISSLSPKGVLPELRETSTRDIAPFQVTYRDPTGVTEDIGPAGERGGSLDRIHYLDFNITLVEPN